MIQNSPEWFAARKCKITSSRFGDVLASPTTKRYRNYQQELIDNITGVPNFGEDSKPWFKHGAEMEAEARAQYEWYMLSNGKEVAVQEIAMIVHPKYDFISCSPDGVIYPKKGIEIKSRISHKSHLESIKAGLPSNYKPQVLGGLWISGYDEWDFISFFKDPDGMIDMDINVTTIFPDVDYFNKLETACLRFWEEIQDKINGVDKNKISSGPSIPAEKISELAIDESNMKNDTTTETKELIVAKELVSSDIFKAGGMDAILEEIAKKAKAHVPDLVTVKGRKAIASNAAKVASSKTLLDGMGKKLKETYKIMIDPIDGERRKTREFLDSLKIEVRQPLTDWEAAEEKRKADEALAVEQAEWDAAVIADYDQAFESAISENDLFNRERDMRKKEEAAHLAEYERKAKEEADRVESERIAHEEQLKRDAAEKAIREAEEKARNEKEDAERQIAEAKASEEKAAREKAEAEARAAQEKKYAAERERLAEERRIQEAKAAEQKRLDDIKAAEEKAAREQREAVQAEQARQAAKEKGIKDAQDEKDRQDAARQADVDHRSKINNQVKSGLMLLGIEEEKAIEVVKAIVKGEIRNVSLRY